MRQTNFLVTFGGGEEGGGLHIFYNVFYNIFILQACAACFEKYYSKIDSLRSATTFVPSKICFYYSLLTKLFHDARAITFFCFLDTFQKILRIKNKKMSTKFFRKILFFLRFSFILRIIRYEWMQKTFDYFWSPNSGIWNNLPEIIVIFIFLKYKISSIIDKLFGYYLYKTAIKFICKF